MLKKVGLQAKSQLIDVNLVRIFWSSNNRKRRQPKPSHYRIKESGASHWAQAADGPQIVFFCEGIERHFGEIEKDKI